MPVIKVKKVPREVGSSEDILSKFCYYFPQYKFSEAKEMPYIRVRKMLDVAIKEQAKFYLNLTHIAASPHSKKGSGVKKLLKEYKKIIRS